jgi:hypothetical protein
MPVFPGPALLGRGVVELSGQRVPPECASWPFIVVDAAALSNPAPVADELHDGRRPSVAQGG